MKKSSKATKATTKRTVKAKGNVAKGGPFTLKVPGVLAKAIIAKADGNNPERFAIDFLKAKFC